MSEQTPQTPQQPPTQTAPMNGQPNPSQAPSGPERPVDGAPVQGLDGTVATLVATVDQHSAELDTLGHVQLAQAFAFGALCGIVFLLARRLPGLEP